MGKVKSFISRVAKKGKALVAMAAVGVVTAVSAVVASAAEPTAATGLASYSDQIKEQFANTANDIVPIIIGILGSALGIYGLFLCIRLGKKMLGTVSKG